MKNHFYYEIIKLLLWKQNHKIFFSNYDMYPILKK